MKKVFAIVIDTDNNEITVSDGDQSIKSDGVFLLVAGSDGNDRVMTWGSGDAIARSAGNAYGTALSELDCVRNGLRQVFRKIITALRFARQRIGQELTVEEAEEKWSDKKKETLH